MTPEVDAGAPLFVGGTGRSGTHPVARLIGRHSRYHYISREMHFHVDRGGLPDLLAGRVKLDRFLRNMRGYWWQRPGPRGGTIGLSGKVPEPAFEAALEEFERTFRWDPTQASARLVSALLDPLAEEAGKPAWVEQTPWNVSAAPTLLAMFPRARVVHMVRDGRDVACSVVTRNWGPKSPVRAIRWWEKRMRAAAAGERGIPPDRLLVVGFERLVSTDRERTYRRLLDFLELDDEPRMRRYFDRKLSPERANIGRWRADLPGARRDRLNHAYGRALRRLHASGVDSAPALEAAGLPPAAGGRMGSALEHLRRW